MIRKDKAKMGLSGITPTDLVEKGRLHVESCHGNPDVPLPPDFLATLAAACDALELANFTMRENGGKRDRLIRDARVWEVKNLIRNLAGYVNANCQADGEKILRAGFDLHKTPLPVGILEGPQNVQAKRGKLPGEVRLNWKGKRGKLYYELEINAGDTKVPEDWKPLTWTGRNYYTVTGLETDRPYYFRVRAVGTAGQGMLSDVAMCKAA